MIPQLLLLLLLLLLLEMQGVKIEIKEGDFNVQKSMRKKHKI
jgi:hypothetical protein